MVRSVAARDVEANSSIATSGTTSAGRKFQTDKDADGPFRIVIVRDMWLTMFDTPSSLTIYEDAELSPIPFERITDMQSSVHVDRRWAEALPAHCLAQQRRCLGAPPHGRPHAGVFEIPQWIGKRFCGKVSVLAVYE